MVHLENGCFQRFAGSVVFFYLSLSLLLLKLQLQCKILFFWVQFNNKSLFCFFFFLFSCTYSTMICKYAKLICELFFKSLIVHSEISHFESFAFQFEKQQTQKLFNFFIYFTELEKMNTSSTPIDEKNVDVDPNPKQRSSGASNIGKKRSLTESITHILSVRVIFE